jgi:hypothetical protein
MKQVRALIAESFAQRAVGLLMHSRLQPRAGIWFDRCSTVHSLGMRMAIDLVFLDGDFRIVRTITAWGPSRIAHCSQAASVLELASGVISQLQWRVGDQLHCGNPNSFLRQRATWRTMILSP